MFYSILYMCNLTNKNCQICMADAVWSLNVKASDSPLHIQRE